MQLDRISIALRPRQGWEAIDLGFRMAAHWARPLWTVWFAVYLPVGIGLLFALRENPYLAAVILWWLKPLFDRFLLHVLSRSVFGQTPHWSETARAWREILQPGLLGSLFTRFWDFRRSFNMPVLQLERQRGSAARARRRLLGQRTGGFAVALTLICVHLELVVMIGLYSLTALFEVDVQLAPEDGSPDIAFEQFFNLEWWSASDTLVYMLAVSLIEPFYVAAGFALYLNRRVLLEGWDVEVAMRRLAMRQRELVATGRRAALSLLAVLLIAGLALPPIEGLAAATESTPGVERGELPDARDSTDAEAVDSADEDSRERSDDAETKDGEQHPLTLKPLDTPARRLADEVIADPLFGSDRTVERWRPLDQTKAATASSTRNSRGWFAELVALLAEIFRALAWIGLVALVLALAVLLARQRRAVQSAPEAAAPATLFGLAISPQSLPADIVAAARAALAAGQLREALSLLYRGALSQLIHIHGLRVGAGATESDVLRLARAQMPDAAGFFESLLPTWMESAYAGRLPQIEHVEQLCGAYAASLGAAAVAPATELA